MRSSIAIIVALLLFPAAAVKADYGADINMLLRVPVPEKLTLCGEEVPLSREDVAERLEYELMVVLSDPLSTALWFKRRERYFPMIDGETKKRGLPSDLRYVPVVESNLRTEAVSSARATGPWQFMSGTGRAYGLKRDSWRDERKHWEEATDAGLRHLKDLYEELDSWLLAMAAYNAGKKRVTDAMKKQGQSDFYGLQLPRETERYVFRIMAAKLVMERPEDFGIDLEGFRPFPRRETAKVSVKVRRSQLPLSVIADAAGLSYHLLKTFNAWITGNALPKGTHTLTIPESATDSFQERLNRWRKENPEPKVVYYRVTPGDTLSLIAQRHGVRLSDLLSWNSMGTRSIIYPGQKIAIRRTN